MIPRFALALDVSTDFLLGLAESSVFPADPDLKIIKRLKQIESLPQRQKKSLLLTIDNYLKANSQQGNEAQEGN
jgi:hypothetical protein